LPPITRPFRADLPELERLLAEAGLDATGLPAALDDYLIARDGERLVGAVGAEYRGAVALLRALVVAGAERGHGLGQALLEAIRVDARRMEARYLLVPAAWAAGYFARQGFSPSPPTREQRPTPLAWTRRPLPTWRGRPSSML